MSLIDDLKSDENNISFDEACRRVADQLSYTNVNRCMAHRYIPISHDSSSHWYPGERGQIMRRFNSGLTVMGLSYLFRRSEHDIEDAIRHMTRKGSKRGNA